MTISKPLHWAAAMFFFLPTFALAAGAVPACPSDKGPVPIDNAQVLQWKTSTPNQFLARAHVSGAVTRIYPDRNGHNHFEIRLGASPTDTLEVVYNISFGKLPELKEGMNVEACGDYITSDAPTPQYQPSPDGAIIHWIHRNPSSHGHPSGFLVIDGQLYGQGNGHGG